jgi:hypothetical protein
MSKEKNNSLTLYIVIIVGCLTLGGAYYLIEKNKQEEVRKEAIEREIKYNKCMEDAYEAYVFNWEVFSY